MSFKTFINTPIEKIRQYNVVSISENDLPSDVLERLEDTEIFTDEQGLGRRIYSMQKLHNILVDEDDDTNETTRYRLELLYKKLKGNASWFMIYED